MFQCHLANTQGNLHHHSVIFFLANNLYLRKKKNEWRTGTLFFASDPSEYWSTKSRDALCEILELWSIYLRNVKHATPKSFMQRLSSWSWQIHMAEYFTYWSFKQKCFRCHYATILFHNLCYTLMEDLRWKRKSKEGRIFQLVLINGKSTDF